MPEYSEYFEPCGRCDQYHGILNPCPTETFEARADSTACGGYANQAAGRKLPTAEEWWIKIAAFLCQKADQSGVTAFRITKVAGKWVFEITPEEQPDSHTAAVSHSEVATGTNES